MLRRLLTLLAVISGLGLAAEPALAVQASVVSVAAAGEAEQCQTMVSGPQMLARQSTNRITVERPLPRPAISIVAPPVQLKADRARE